MKIVIVGAGFTGIQLAKRLINGKNDVTLIDEDEEVARNAENMLDCAVFAEPGNNLETLERAGIKDADALVCVTNDDELNMITCSLVDSVYPEVKKIARVRNYAYYVDTASVEKGEKNKRPLYGIDYMIHPDVEAAEAIVNAAKHGAITDVTPFGDNYELIRVTIEKGSKLEGQQLMNVRKITGRPVTIAYLERDGESSLPSGETVLHAEDSLGALMLKEDTSDFLKLCGSHVKSIKKIAIVGADRVGTIVTEKLITRKSTLFTKLFKKKGTISQQIAVIDSDEEKTNAIALKYPGIKVFHADASDEQFLEEEGIDKYDLVIFTTPNYELNIVMAKYIESLGVENSIALVFSNAFGEIARKIGIEVAVPVRDTVVDSIMSHLKGDAVSNIKTVNDGSLEQVSVIITENSPVKGLTLRDISENGNFLVLLIKKADDEDYSIPIGSTVLEEGDKVELITTAEANQHVLEKFGSVN